MNAGERAARERVEAVYAAVDRLGPDELSQSTIPDRDLEERTVLLADLEREADRFGRGPLLGEARTWLGEALAQRLASRAFHAEAGALAVSTVGRPEDIAEVRLAIEDAVSVAVAEDLIEPAAAASLAEPGRWLLGMEPLPGSPPDAGPAARAWEPTPADWEAATDEGPSAVDHDEPVGGARRLRAWFFAAVGAFAVLVAVAAGVAGGDWPLSILGAIAVIALAWTFATWRRPVAGG